MMQIREEGGAARSSAVSTETELKNMVISCSVLYSSSSHTVFSLIPSAHGVHTVIQ